MQPIAFLDVDGPLNVDDSAGRFPLLELELQPDRLFPVRLDPGHAGMVKRLSEGFELVWATIWEDLANLYLLDHLGLAKPLPWVPFDAEWQLPPPEILPPRKRSWQPYCAKAPSVLRYAGDRPFVWFDDDFVTEDHEWAKSRNTAGSPTLLVEVDPEYGLMNGHVHEALIWRAEHSLTI